MGFTRINPLNWPQDDYAIPDGLGGMPPVDGVNAVVTRREFFGLSQRFLFPDTVSAYQGQTVILPTPQDGDFWCDQIAVVSWLANPEGEGVTKDIQSFLASMVGIVDVRTGLSPIYSPSFDVGVSGQLFPSNTVPINLFRKLPQSGTENSVAYDGTTPPPSGFRATWTLNQPWCFTRQGGVQLSVTPLFDVPDDETFDVTIGFTGWKEFAHASR
jgi:hypothetical protein